MRLVFLGTGTSAGVPAIACACGVCTSSDPRDTRLRTGAAVCWTDESGQERVVLIDATPDLRQQALANKLKRCDAIVFTHNHVDHTFGLDEVRRFNAVQGGPIPVFAEPHTLEHLRRVFRHVFDREANVNDSFVADLIPFALEAPAAADGGGAGRPVELWGVRFTPVRLLHGRLPIVGFRIERVDGRRGGAGGGVEGGGEGGGVEGAVFPLVYATDVSAIPPRSYGAMRGLGTLVLDALRHRKHPTHLSLQEALDVAGQVGAGRTYFVHMAHDLGHAETEAGLPEGVRLAFDGLVLEEGRREAVRGE